MKTEQFFCLFLTKSNKIGIFKLKFMPNSRHLFFYFKYSVVVTTLEHQMSIFSSFLVGNEGCRQFLLKTYSSTMLHAVQQSLITNTIRTNQSLKVYLHSPCLQIQFAATGSTFSTVQHSLRPLNLGEDKQIKIKNQGKKEGKETSQRSAGGDPSLQDGQTCSVCHRYRSQRHDHHQQCIE